MTSVTTSSTEELPATAGETAQDASGDRLSRFLVRVATWLESAVDRANPILVKETRQALKSRQFVVTFLIVLIACWIASFAVVAITGPSVFYGAEGGRMLIVYCAILAFPLILIVPYSAFRSLAAEQEDNTYDLLSITTLSTGQIITGKLGSAVVQMLVYLSAVSPCIAFTFLLRGVDALTVAVLLGYYVSASLGLSMLALLAGTFVKVRHVQILLTVLLILGLALGLYLVIAFSYIVIQEGYSFLRGVEFWVGNLALLTFYASTFALVHAAAAAQIAFTSENRSTPLRRLMMLQQACFLGWISVAFVVDGFRAANETVFIAALFSGIYWYVMGTLLTSEWPYLSRRVQRNLPQSQLGRFFLTWFNPGPGTGFMFCVANLTMIAAMGLVFLWLFSSLSRRPAFSDQLFFFITFGWCYIITLLGLGNLLISFARRYLFVSMTAGFLLHMILLLLACGVPQVVAFLSAPRQFGNQYTMLHMSNPVWTLYVLIDQGTASLDMITLGCILGATALVVLLLNMRTVTAEVQHQRRVLPARVVEEEAELHPAPEPRPSNPWEN